MAYRTKLSYEGRDDFLHVTLNQTNFIDQIIQETKGKVVVNIGSGNQRPIPHAINVDFQDGSEVDSIKSAYELSFEDSSVDFVFSIGLLEHLKYPHKAIDEFKRILKPGGKIYCEVPFLQPLHPSPEDYWRTTVDGLETWLEDFEKIESGLSSGPSSTLSWFLAEYEKYIPGVFDDSSPFVPMVKGLIKYIDDYLLYENKLDFKKAEKLACSIFFYGRKKYSSIKDREKKYPLAPLRSLLREEKLANYIKKFSFIKDQIRNALYQKAEDGKLAVYGKGDLAELIISALNTDNITAVIEPGPVTPEKQYFGLPVISINDIQSYCIKNIIIASHAHKREINRRISKQVDTKKISIIEVNI
ncbi:class I SAM-dependent methyltransferase [bacterium]|nr:class I SAM-dependent methyltransferase [bacterium]